MDKIKEFQKFFPWNNGSKIIEHLQRISKLKEDNLLFSASNRQIYINDEDNQSSDKEKYESYLIKEKDVN